MKPKPTPKVLRGEGSNRKKEKGVACSWSMRDLCRVKARVPNEPYMAREIAELLESVGDSPLKASLPLVKEIYTTPSKVLVDNVAKNLVMVRHVCALALCSSNCSRLQWSPPPSKVFSS
ncbi:hypothetical protein B296_00014893 [Ensete ventricosum]|uniref:Uncharacterized protein n=1 Tax=Ensete ventricosum TaxID=4639 RepID=A0A426XIK5_ENSVE|nr:hypothetical protein B296_00014893 [Ensete ventricosum]